MLSVCQFVSLSVRASAQLLNGRANAIMVNNPLYEWHEVVVAGGGGNERGVLRGLCKFHNRTQNARHVCAGVLPRSLPFSLSLSLPFFRCVSLLFPFDYPLFLVFCGHVRLLPNENGASLLFTGHFYWAQCQHQMRSQSQSQSLSLLHLAGGAATGNLPMQRAGHRNRLISAAIKSRRHIKLETEFGSAHTR